jgi:hypothetical protein
MEEEGGVTKSMKEAVAEIYAKTFVDPSSIVHRLPLLPISLSHTNTTRLIEM